MQIKKISFVWIASSNMERSKEFFEMIGLKSSPFFDGKRGWLELKTKEEGIVLEWGKPRINQFYR